MVTPNISKEQIRNLDLFKTLLSNVGRGGTGSDCTPTGTGVFDTTIEGTAGRLLKWIIRPLVSIQCGVNGSLWPSLHH